MNDFSKKNDETWSHGDVLRLYEITIAGSWEKNTAPQLGAAVPQNVSEGMMALINHDPWDPYPNH